ncbi:MAG: PQQ-binding-like beta-propeller repeat protein [Planctomycetes bacterium]|nr:PQQ-binding-like beta-propeller repeat protein [Planctomycetota bacterium]
MSALTGSLRITCFSLVLLSLMATQADDWPHWRGSRRTDISAENSGWTGSNWIDAKPRWSVDVGDGASSPIAVGSHVYTLGYRDEKDIVTCLQAANGGTEWSMTYPTRQYGRNATGDEGLYSGPTSTPEFDSGTQWLYTLGADGDLNCWDTAKRGQRVWQRNLYDDYRMPQRAKVGRSGRRDYGYTTAPLVHGEWLLVEVGGPTGTIVAFDKRTGIEQWRSEATGVAGHTGGLAPITVEGISCLAVMTFDGLLVIRLDPGHQGKTVATYPWITDFANNIASPAVQDDCVLITSEYNHKVICKLRITLKGAEKLWEQPFSSKTCTPVIHSGRIYVAWNRIRALDWQTGKLLWEGPAIGDAGSCVVTKDDKLILWANRGELILADIAVPEQSAYVELSRVSRLAKSDVWPHVVVAHDQIYCRDRQGQLACFGSTKRP